MYKSRKDLEILLDKIFITLDPKSNEYKNVQALMMQYNYLPGATNSVLRRNRPISDIEERELYWISNSIFSSYKEGALFAELDPKTWFTSKEIQSYDGDKIGTDKITYPIIFKDVFQLSDDQWMCVLPQDVIQKLYQSQIINYNPNTQRAMRRRKQGEDTRYEINLSRAKVTSICESMLCNLYIPDEITLNICTDNPEADFSYGNGVLKLLSGQMDIIDGYHRYYSIIECLRRNPDFEINIQVKICSFSEQKARKFIVQKDRQTPMKKNLISSYGVSDSCRVFASRINENSACVLHSKLYQYNTSGVDYMAFLNVMGEYSEKVQTRQAINAVLNDFCEYVNEYSAYSNVFSDVDMYCIVIGFFESISVEKAYLVAQNMDKNNFRRKKANLAGQFVKKMFSEVENT